MSQQLTLEQALAVACSHQNAGRLADAEAMYRQILAQQPNEPNSLYLLGMIAQQVGQAEAALELFRQSAHFAPDAPEPRAQLAMALFRSGKLGEALQHADIAMTLNPRFVPALHARASALCALSRWEEAAPIWEQILALAPNDTVTWANYSATLGKIGRVEESVSAARRAIELGANTAHAFDNYGAALTNKGNVGEAQQWHRRAIAVDPSFAPAYRNLAYCCYFQDDIVEGEPAARKAVELAPQDAAANRMLAVTLEQTGNFAEAQNYWARTIDLLERAHAAQRSSGGNVSAIRSELARARLLKAASFPRIYDSIEQLEASRQQLLDGVKKLHDDGLQIDLDDESAPPLFSVAYHGRSEVELQRDLARLMRAPPSPPLPKRDPASKIRVAFISRFLRRHTIGQLNRGLIALLNRDDFDVIVFSISASDDTTTAFIREHAQAYVTLPESLRESRRLIAAQRPDILFYTDIGMEPISYSLGFSRLAAVQCVTWGHPITTGIDNIDYFISAVQLDSEDAQKHYTEQLVRLPSLAVYYYRPTLAEPHKTRADFDLPADANLYGCLQALWKYHPEFDALLAEILRRDPRGRVVVLEGNSAVWRDRLRDRLAKSMGADIDRVIFLPGQKHADFLALTAACDLMLDPIHFGGGNTGYEAFAFGVPVVTWPSEFLRGRIALAQYKAMGIDDCIASSAHEYIDIAVRLGTDREVRAALRARILAVNSVLYENPAGIRELEEFFKQALAKKAKT